jgi:hypothetical protein
MMSMMEKYANNLEALVDERTEQLLEEKKKTGKLRNAHRSIVADALNVQVTKRWRQAFVAKIYS